MKNVVILQNSYFSFGLDVEKIYQPHKYNLHLIVNEFGFNIIKCRNQDKHFKTIAITNNFEYENILSLTKSCIQSNDNFDVVTNSEETMPVCGEIRAYLQIDKENYSRFYNKHVMKTRLTNNLFVHVPKYQIFDSLKYIQNPASYFDFLTNNFNYYPLFAKPTQLCGSVNLKKIHNYTELSKWAQSVNTNESYEIDEFIAGTMYHCDSYIKDNKILFTFVSQNSRPCYDFTIGKIKGTIVLPANHPDSVLLTNITERILHQIGMPKAGVTHLEVIKTYDNKVYFIEVAHRSPGCLIPRMYKEHAGIDTITSHLLLQIDPDYIPEPKIHTYSAWACYPKIPGTVYDLIPPPHLESHYDIEWHTKIGDIIKTYSQFGRDYTGTIFMTNKNFEKLNEEFRIINEINLCQIVPSSFISQCNFS